jgi:protein gp37
LRTARSCRASATLREAPAGLRFLSIEPLIGHVGTLDLTGSTGSSSAARVAPGARTINPEWVRDILIGNCLAGLSRTDGPGSS